MINSASAAFQRLGEMKQIGLNESDVGSLQFLESYYLREVWVSELDPSLSTSQTEESAILVVEGGSKPEFLQNTQWIEVKNIFAAIQYLNICCSGVKREEPIEFSISLIKEVHRLVADQVIAKGGEYRTVLVGASGTGIFILDPLRLNSD